MIISCEDAGTLALKFDYDPATINRIKQIRGYRWHPDKKVWTLPKTERVVFELKDAFPSAFWDGDAKSAPERIKGRTLLADIDASDIPDRPPGFRKDCPPLRPYQKIGAKFCIVNERVLLADAMGVGKTVTSLASVELSGKQNCLVICQAANIETWNQEILKWTGRISMEVNAKNRKKHEKMGFPEFKAAVLKAKYVVTNYEMLAKFDFYKNLKWDAIVIDEAHNFRTRRSIRAKCARALRSDMFIAATGTPIINRHIEMHNVLDMITRGDFGSYEDFWLQYCGGATKQIVTGAYCPRCRAKRKTVAAPCWKCKTTDPALRQFMDVPDYSVATNMANLKSRLEGIMIARRRSEVLTELPKHFRINKLVRMTDAQEKTYRQIWDDLFNYLVENKGKGLEEAERSCRSETLTRIGYGRQHLAMCKAEVAVEHAKEAMASGDSVIIYANYQAVVNAVKGFVETGDDPFRCFLHTGATSPTSRALLLEEFRRTPSSALAATLASGSVGLNLQNANHTFVLDYPWTATELAQAWARTLRMGQLKECFFYHYFIAGTYDEKILDMTLAKQSLANEVTGGDIDVIEAGGSAMLKALMDDVFKGMKDGGEKKSLMSSVSKMIRTGIVETDQE